MEGVRKGVHFSQSKNARLLNFSLFIETLQFLQQINVKTVHPVYGAGIRTQDLQNKSFFEACSDFN